jgi:solute carrier family 50 protein (sugar transporter)
MLRFLADQPIGAVIVSAIGTMISIGLNLTPILLFYRYFKGTAGIQTIPEMMFITGIFCCATNLAYGIIKDDKILKISNGCCYGLQILYGTIYIFITNKKQVHKLLLYLLIAWDLSFEVLFIFGNILEYHCGNSFANRFTGITNMIIGTLNVITPGQNIVKVFKTGNFTLIPIVTIFFQCTCSTLWLVYGFTDMDWNMIVPNGLGTLITALQISTYYFFYCKLHGIPPKEEKKEGEEDEEGKEDKEGTEGKEETKDNEKDKLLVKNEEKDNKEADNKVEKLLDDSN